MQMFDLGFFRTQLGQAALVSVAAMIAFTVFAQIQHDVAGADMIVTSAPTAVELA